MTTPAGPAFTEHRSTLGDRHVDYRCAAAGCSWHKTIALDGARLDRVELDLREHARSHRGTPA